MFYTPDQRSEGEVRVLWLELVLRIEAVLALVIAGTSGVYFARYAFMARQPARRVGAAALVTVHAALVLEAATFLLFSSSPGGLERAALLALRTLLLGAVGFVQALIWRQGWRRP